MVGQVRLGLLLSVAGQALFVLSPAKCRWTAFLLDLTVNRMAVAALDVLRLVRTGKPVAHVIGFGVTTQAGAIGLLRRTVFEADDFVLRLLRVATGLHMQAAG